MATATEASSSEATMVASAIEEANVEAGPPVPVAEDSAATSSTTFTKIELSNVHVENETSSKETNSIQSQTKVKFRN